MDIENIVTDEFADYKVGFVNGKNDILNFLVGRVEFEEFSDIEDWYTMDMRMDIRFIMNII